LFLPHAWWTALEGFSTIRYAAAHVPGGGRWIGHVLCPLLFLVVQCGILTGLAAVVLVATGGRVRLRRAAAPEGHDRHRWPAHGMSATFPRRFLAVMVLGPLVAHLGVSLLGNTSLRPAYGAPLWLWAGLLAMVSLEVRPEPARWRKTWIAWAVVVTALGGGATIATLAAPYVLHKPSRCLFPGRQLAAEVDKVWRSHEPGPLPIVAGDYFLAGTVAFFDRDRPRVYQSSDELINDTGVHDCPWLGDDEFRRRGGVILWGLDADPEGLPPDVLRRFRVSRLVTLPPLDYLTGADLPPARIGVAIVPPEP
jgi:hypothetical protein